MSSLSPTVTLTKLSVTPLTLFDQGFRGVKTTLSENRVLSPQVIVTLLLPPQIGESFTVAFPPSSRLTESAPNGLACWKLPMFSTGYQYSVQQSSDLGAKEWCLKGVSMLSIWEGWLNILPAWSSTYWPWLSVRRSSQMPPSLDWLQQKNFRPSFSSGLE